VVAWAVENVPGLCGTFDSDVNCSDVGWLVAPVGVKKVVGDTSRVEGTPGDEESFCVLRTDEVDCIVLDVADATGVLATFVMVDVASETDGVSD